ncbi:MAG: hypothetical protein MUF72_07285 [Elainella sp. Prado103]|jgi:hypothetical protein|nr:hypothetical protein [Elainella sp. Prado103]
MTTQVLMSNNIQSTEAVSSSAQANQVAKLPYQANHQVELMHLQAEIEALLQQLKCLKQQRGGDAIPESVSHDLPVLATR